MELALKESRRWRVEKCKANDETALFSIKLTWLSVYSELVNPYLPMRLCWCNNSLLEPENRLDFAGEIRRFESLKVHTNKPLKCRALPRDIVYTDSENLSKLIAQIYPVFKSVYILIISFTNQLLKEPLITSRENMSSGDAIFLLGPSWSVSHMLLFFGKRLNHRMYLKFYSSLKVRKI